MYSQVFTVFMMILPVLLFFNISYVSGGHIRSGIKSLAGHVRRFGKFSNFFLGTCYVKNSSNHISDKGAISRLYKECSKVISIKNNLIRKWAKNMNRYFTEEDIYGK